MEQKVQNRNNQDTNDFTRKLKHREDKWFTNRYKPLLPSIGQPLIKPLLFVQNGMYLLAMFS